MEEREKKRREGKKTERDMERRRKSAQVLELKKSSNNGEAREFQDYLKENQQQLRRGKKIRRLRDGESIPKHITRTPPNARGGPNEASRLRKKRDLVLSS